MARTNKMGILKKKQQQAKQKELVGSKTRSNEGMKRTFTNPKGNEYEWFMRAGKRVNDTTSCREDPDGFRIRRKPSGGEVEFIPTGKDSRGYRKYVKNAMRMSRK